ncbi:MAG: hypothetical protein AB7Q97_10830 [Gammaproteobacteria bacterium]
MRRASEHRILARAFVMAMLLGIVSICPAAQSPAIAGIAPVSLQQIPGRRGISVLYRGHPVAVNFARVEVYAIRPLGGRKPLLRWPADPVEWSRTDTGGFRAVHGGGPGTGTLEIKVELTADGGIDLQGSYAVPDGVQALGIQFDVASFLADWLVGGSVSWVGGAAGVTAVPTPSERRVLAQESGTIVAHGTLLNVEVRDVAGEASLSAADMRSMPWDSEQTVLVTSNRRPLRPGAKEAFRYIITMRPTARARLPLPAAEFRAPRTTAVASDSTANVTSSGRPAIAVRGQLVELAKPARRDVALFKRYIDVLAAHKANTLVLHHRPDHVRALLQLASPPGWWTEADLREVAIYASKRGIVVIPGMVSKLSKKYFDDVLPKGGESDFHCTSDPKAYEVMFALYGKLVEMYRPGALFIGRDEIRNINACEPTVPAADVFSEDVRKVHDWLKVRGVRTIIAGDMLLDRDSWDARVGSSNSGNPAYGGHDTAKAIDAIPRDVIILDWHYTEKPDYPSIGYFRSKGFEVWGMSWYNPRSALTMARSVRRDGGAGLLGSDFGFWSTLNPGATSMFALAAAWNPDISPPGSDAAAVADLALRLRPPSHGAAGFQTIELDAVNDARADSEAFDGRGFVDAGPALDLSSVPMGRQSLAGVAFEVPTAGAPGLDLIAARSGEGVGASERSARLTLGGARYKSLAFLHAAYMAMPTVYPREVGRYVIEYQDASREIVPLVEGLNIADMRAETGLRVNPWRFRSGIDEILGALPGWRGYTRAGVPITLHVLRWENPRPEKPLRAVTIQANEIGTRMGLALVALSGVHGEDKDAAR